MSIFFILHRHNTYKQMYEQTCLTKKTNKKVSENKESLVGQRVKVKLLICFLLNIISNLFWEVVRL